MTIGGLWAIFVFLVLFAVIQVIKKYGDKGQAENNHQQVATNEIGFVSCSDSRYKDHCRDVVQFCTMDENLSIHAAIVLYGSELRNVDTDSLLDFFSKKKLGEEEVYDNLSPADLGELRTILDAQLRFDKRNTFLQSPFKHYKELIEKKVTDRIKAFFLNHPTVEDDCGTKFLESFVELFQFFDQAACQLELLNELKTHENLWEKLIAGKNFLAGLKAALIQSFDTLYGKEILDCYALLG